MLPHPAFLVGPPLGILCLASQGALQLPEFATRMFRLETNNGNSLCYTWGSFLSNCISSFPVVMNDSHLDQPLLQIGFGMSEFLL